MKKYYTLIMLAAIFMNLTACATPKARFDITVIDEETSLPVESAEVKFNFMVDGGIIPGQGFTSNITYDKQSKKTNINGKCTATGAVNMLRAMPIMTQMYGYYPSGIGSVGVKKMNSMKKNKLLNRWEPWPCELTVKLRPIKNQVSMFVKFIGDPLEGKTSIPEKNIEIGYDLETGDWVSPYGKGKIRDLIFKMKEGERGLNKVKFDTFDLSFSNEHDGIQEFSPLKGNQSSFTFPYLAPVQKYTKNYQFFRKWIKTERYGYQFKGDNMDDKKFIFRVRTKVDLQGNILSAQYGILSGVGFSIYKDKFRTFAFTYKLNPDNQSRSLEFSGENLFKDRDEKGRLKD